MTEDETLLGTGVDSSPATQVVPLARGDTVGRYVVLDKLGSGGIGIVYAAYDPELDRKIAVKLLRGWSEASGAASEGHQRLLREAQAMAKLSHPNVIAVHDVGARGGSVYVAMEFVDGGTLGAWLAEREREWKDVLATFAQAGRGLAAAHARGLVHRDFKPDNVMLGRDGRARVLDFGLVRPADEPVETRDHLESPSQEASAGGLTIAGAVMGTPAYMAPEQHLGAEVGPAADQFAFCVSLWEGLFGERPFAGVALPQLAASVTAGEIREPSRSGPPRWVRRVLERGLSVEPGDRWPSMQALLGALEGGHARTRRTRIFAALGLTAACGVAVFGWQQRDRATRVRACDQAGAAIHESWNDDARSAVHRGLVASGAGHADQTAERLMPRLDAAAVRWSEAATNGCTHETVDRSWTDDQSERSRWCLGNRRHEFEALVEGLKRADVEAVTRSVAAAAVLRTGSDCVDAEVLERRPAPPPRLREEVAAVEATLSLSWALDAVAAYDEGLVVARDGFDRAQAIDWLPLRARAALRLGRMLNRTGKPKDAEAQLEAAFFLAEEAGATEISYSATQTLVFAVGMGQARYTDGLRWSKMGELLRSRLADTTGLREAGWLNSEAGVRGAMGEHDEARRLHARALELREGSLDADHPQIAETLNNLAIVRQAVGAFDEAMVLHERALLIRERGLGAHHPFVAQTLSNLAVVYRSKGRTTEALALNERALAIRKRAFGPEHPFVANSLNNIAVLYKGMQRFDEAEGLYKESLAINEKVSGSDHPNVASCLSNLAELHLATGKGDEARQEYARALEIFDEALGKGHVLAAYPLLGLAAIARTEGRVGEALPLAERALALREANSVAPSLLAAARFEMARVLAKKDPRSARVVELADQAHAGYQEAGVTDKLEHLAEWRATLGSPTAEPLFEGE